MKIKNYYTLLAGNPIIPIEFNQEFLADYRSRHSQIDALIVAQKGSLTLISDDLDVIKNMILASCFNHLYQWKTQFNTTQLEYNPLWNVDGTETTTRSFGSDVTTHEFGAKSSSVTIGEQSTSSSNSNFAVAYDSTTEKETGKVTGSNSVSGRSDSTSDAAYQNTDSRAERTESETLVRSGNIGVTSSQNLLTQEREVAYFNFMQIVFEDIFKDVCIPIWCDEFADDEVAKETDYRKLTNKPTINGVELVGNRTTGELGLKTYKGDGSSIEIDTDGTIHCIKSGGGGEGGTDDYNDLVNKPRLNGYVLSGNKSGDELGLFSGAYADLTGKPELFSGDYEDLTNKPTLFDGDYESLTNKPTLFSGEYNDLTGKPELFSGDYEDLINKPTIPDVSGIESDLEDVKEHLGEVDISEIGDSVTDSISNLNTSLGGVSENLEELTDELRNVNSSLGTATNMMKPTLQSQVLNGVTCTNNNGTYTLNGTASEGTIFQLSDFIAVNKPLKIVGSPNGASNTNYYLYTSNYDVNKTWSSQSSDFGEGSIISNCAYTRAFIVVRKGIVLNNVVFKPMLTTNLNAQYSDFVTYTGSTGKLNSDVAELNRKIVSGTFTYTPTMTQYSDNKLYRDITDKSITVNGITSNSIIFIGITSNNKAWVGRVSPAKNTVIRLDIFSIENITTEITFQYIAINP